MSDWLVESLRCTVFPMEPGAVLADFAVAMGVAPDRVDAQPKLGITQESAVMDDGVTTVALERVPLLAHFRMGMPPEARITTGVDLPELSVANEAFLDRAATWLCALPHLSRLAYGAVFLRPVSSRVEGYEVLGTLLHSLKVDPRGSQDLRFQINRPRDIEFDGEVFRINRLTKWTVRKALLAAMSPDRAVTTPLGAEYHVMLDLDVNTIQGHGVVPEEPQRVLELFKTLVGLGVEISEQGDVA